MEAVDIKEKKRYLKIDNVNTKKKKNNIGFTNYLAVFIMLLLTSGLAGGFYLALLSIYSGYTGGLMCWTVVFTPLGTALGVVLSKIVDKSRAENTGADGEGIKYATAKASGFRGPSEVSVDSPQI